MGLRELKETAHQQFVRGKFAQCAQTYQQVLRLAPRDPNMHVRYAEVCRRVGDRQQSILAYRTAADLLLELGCESRARGALKAALELDPNDALLLADIARLGPHHDETFAPGYFGERDELPLLPPLESGLDPVPPAPPAQRPRVPRHEELMRTPSLPPIHRALPAAPSVPPLGPPVLLPAPGERSAASNQRPAPTLPPRSASMGQKAPAPRPGQAALPQHTSVKAGQPPVLHPVAGATAANLQAASQTPKAVLVPPPPPAEALLEATRSVPPADSSPRLEVRRLSSSTLAFRSSPNDSWAVIRSHTPLEMHLVEDLEKLPPMMRDFSPEAMVELAPEAASSTVH